MTWQTKKLGEVCEIITGGTPKTSVKDFYGNEFLWAGPSDLDRGIFVTNTNKKLSKKGFRESGIRLVPKGSVLLSCIGNIGKIGIAVEQMATNQQINTFVPNENFLDSKYLYYALIIKTEEFKLASSQTTLPIINKTKCSNIEIPLPSLSEQKRIVKILDEKMGKIAEAKKVREEALADTEKILSQTLHEIFEEGKKKGWEEKSFDDKKILKMTSGGTPSRGNKYFYNNGEISWLKSGELQDNTNIIDSEEKITKDAVKKSSAKLFPVGTVLFAMYGATAGKIGILGIESSTNQAVAGLIPVVEKLNNKFLYYFLMKKREEIIAQAWGGAQPNLSQTILKTFSIPLPSLPEQQKIVKRLDVLSAKIRQAVELQKSQLEDLKKLEQSYLREAFNGELV